MIWLAGMAAKAWFKPLLAGLLAVAVMGMVWRLVSYIQGAEEAKAAVITLTERLNTAQNAAKANETAFNACLLVNQRNEEKAAQARLQAAQGVIRIAELELAAAAAIGRMDREVEVYRTDLGCAALTAPAFRDWLRDDDS